MALLQCRLWDTSSPICLWSRPNGGCAATQLHSVRANAPIAETIFFTNTSFLIFFDFHISGNVRDMLNSPSIKLHRKLNVPFISGTEAFIAGTFCVEISRPVEEIQCVSWRKADVWGPFSRQTTATAATSSSTLLVFHVMFVWKYKYKTQPTCQALYILQI